MPHPVRGEQRLRAKEHRAAAGSGQLQIVARRRHRAVRDGSEAIGLGIPPAEDAEDTRQPRGTRCFDFQNPSMRVRRADHDDIGLAGQVEIVGEPALAGQQPLILFATYRLADRADRGHGVDVDRIVHPQYLLDAVEREIENVEIA